MASLLYNSLIVVYPAMLACSIPIATVRVIVEQNFDENKNGIALAKVHFCV